MNAAVWLLDLPSPPYLLEVCDGVGVYDLVESAAFEAYTALKAPE